MTDAEMKQDNLNKKKMLTRSDAVVGDDDNKISPSSRQAAESQKKRFSKTSQSRESSYTDTMGVDVLQFVENTLHKNPADREFLLSIEAEIRKFIADESRSYHFFPPLSSYNRMLIHRVAAFFGLIHNVDQSGHQVVVTKQKGHTRVPDIEFSSLIRHSDFEDKYRFGKRGAQSFESHLDGGGNNNFSQSFRHFRNRFYTQGGQAANSSNNNNFRGRRAHSFEIGDWQTGGAAAANFGGSWKQNSLQKFGSFQQPLQLQQQSFNSTGVSAAAAVVGGGGGGGETTITSSNCSSNASSNAAASGGAGTAAPHVYNGGGGLRFQLYPSCQFAAPLFATSNEAALLSPSSAQSEPTSQIFYPTFQSTTTANFKEGGGKTNEIIAENVVGGGGANIYQPPAPQFLDYEMVQRPQQQQQQISSSSSQHIPSLFSVQPIPPAHFVLAGQQQQHFAAAAAQQQPPPYSPVQFSSQYTYQPFLFGAAPPNIQYFDNANLHCYPNYFPIYSQHATFLQQHPLLEENFHNNVRPPLEKQFDSMTICSPEAEKKMLMMGKNNERGGGVNNNKNNNKIGGAPQSSKWEPPKTPKPPKPTCC